MKKRVLSILLVALMVMGLCTAAFAADAYTDASTATFTVKFTGTGHPAETFTFSDFTFETVTNAGVGSNGSVVTTGPAITKIPDVAIAAGADKATATITLPSFEAVGVYTYSFNEVAGSTSGVTYYTTPMKLVVTVVQDGTLKRVAAVHVEGGSTSADKTGVIENTYESATLAVSKTVTGNMGDKSKYFNVTVTFAGEITSAVTYIGGKYTTDTAVDGTTASIQVKDGDTVTFSNIPVGATYTVVETEANQDGYTTTGEVKTATKLTADGATVAIENNKEVTVDTGITMDTIPYIMIALFACLAAAVVVIRKRRIAE